MIEPNSMQQHAIERLRDTYDTLACAPYLPIGTRTWIVAAFEPGIRSEWVELKRWRILPNGETFDVLPGTPSAEQPIAPPPSEAIAGDLAERDVELRLVVSKHNLDTLTDRVPCTAFKLIEQRDGRYGIAVEHTNLPSPFLDTTAGFIAGDLEQMGERR